MTTWKRLTLLVLGSWGLVACGADWPVFRGNALQSGVAATALPEPLTLRWRFQAKDGFEGTAAIVGDTVFVGSMDEHLYALELGTGKVKWQYKGGPFKAPVGVRQGRVYVGDADGLFHCLEAASGKKLWTFETGSEITAGPNFAGDNVLIGSYDETLYCLGPDGKPLWTFKAEGPVNGSPTVAGNRTFVAGCDSALHVLDTASGKELLAVDLGGQSGATPAALGEHIYVGTMTNEFLAIDLQKGEVAWRFQAASRRQPFYASAAVTPELVVVGSRDKRVYGLDRKTGTQVWNFQTRGRVDSSPVVAGNRVLVGSLDNHLYVLDLKSGQEVQKFDLGGPVAASPAVGGGCVVLGTSDGVLYCLGAKAPVANPSGASAPGR